MTDEQDVLPDDVKAAILLERARPDLPLESSAQLVARIEGTREFAAATGSRQVRSEARALFRDVGRAVRTSTGIVIFLIGALWGLALGAIIVLFLTRGG